MSNFGHNTLTINKGATVETLTWSGSDRWDGESHYITKRAVSATEFKWSIITKTSPINVASLASTEFITEAPDPTNESWTNDWTVTEPNTGAQGDPHINPLFGKNYTI